MIATINASPFRGDPHEVLRSPDRSRLDPRRGSRCEASAGTGAKPNGAGDGNETRSHHRRPGHPQGDPRKAERVAAKTCRLSQTGAPTENPTAEAACLRQSLHVAVTASRICVDPALTDAATGFRAGLWHKSAEFSGRSTDPAKSSKKLLTRVTRIFQTRVFIE